MSLQTSINGNAGLGGNVTLAILRRDLKEAPHATAILAALQAQEEAHEDRREIQLAKQERQRTRMLDAQREALRLRNVYERDPDPESKTHAVLKEVEDAEAKAKAEADKLKEIRVPREFPGLSSAKFERAIQKIRFPHRTRKDAKAVEGSADVIAKAQADIAKLTAELNEILNSFCTLDEALKRGNRDVDREVKRAQGAWRVGRYFRNQVDDRGRVRPASVGLPVSPIDNTTPDAWSLLLLTCEPIVRANMERRIKDAYEARVQFENPLTEADRTKKADAIRKKIGAAVAVETAHIRALALAGQCPIIRPDIDIAELLALEPVPEAAAEFEAAEAVIRKRGGTHVDIGARGGATVLREASGFAGPGRARATS